MPEIDAWEAATPEQRECMVGGRRVQVQARDLQPNDIAIGSMTTILDHPRDQGGRVAILVRRRNGRETTVSWGRYTNLTIIRPTKEGTP